MCYGFFDNTGYITGTRTRFREKRELEYLLLLEYLRDHVKARFFLLVQLVLSDLDCSKDFRTLDIIDSIDRGQVPKGVLNGSKQMHDKCMILEL
jgi:hypothetical protein